MGRFLNDRHREEALGVGLTALGVLLALALLPSAVTGGGGEARNLVGPAGEALHRWLTAAFGVATFVVVIPAFVWGLRFFGVLATGVAVRWSVLSGGVLLLLPPGLWLLGGAVPGEPNPTTGWLGGALGHLLVGAFGSLGAWLIVAALLLALTVLTLGWSPVRGVSRATRGVARAARLGSGRLSAAFRGLRGRLRLWGAAGTTATEPLSPWERATPDSGSISDGPTPPAAERAEPPLEGPVAPVAGAADKGAGDGAPALADPGDLAQTALPPLDLLSLPGRSGTGLAPRELRELGDVLIEKLATFRVEGRIGGWTTGPVVTQFEVVPAAGVKVGQIAALSDDLALALRAPSVRIVAPIPGKGAVGVEVPNPEPEVVYLREILESPAYQRSRAVLPLGLGRDLAGNPYCADLARMPHLLIAGATGSGKSICINTLVTSLVYRHTPRELRLLMVDPKMVELAVYNELPHLRHPVVTDNNDAARVLRWAMYQMEGRYALLSANACRNLIEFNRRVRRGKQVHLPAALKIEYDGGILPYIVLVIDELADLIMTVQAEVETPLTILAQKARAVGIHLVVATQRPSVNIITGLIKANFPCRIAFRVASKTDSRTILDQNGAESLLGNGDMLFLPPGKSDPVRLQGAFLDTQDRERLISWYHQQSELRREMARARRSETDILEEVQELEAEEGRGDVAEGIAGEWDELFRQAAEVVINHNSGSTSLLQRRLKIGYGRAARIIDQLQEAGVLGPPDGSKPREVLVTHDQFEAMMRGEDVLGGHG
ncbi:MAG: DNA translocase FtsK [Gemmatimonadota bacterium]